MYRDNAGGVAFRDENHWRVDGVLFGSCAVVFRSETMEAPRRRKSSRGAPSGVQWMEGDVRGDLLSELHFLLGAYLYIYIYAPKARRGLRGFARDSSLPRFLTTHFVSNGIVGLRF